MEFKLGNIDDVVVHELTGHSDDRGWLMELFRIDELCETAQNLTPAMAYISATEPGVVRGPHEHKWQTDVFCFFGPGDFHLYLWDNRKESATYGNFLKLLVGMSIPVSVVVPPGVVHAYKNIDLKPNIVFNAPNRLYAGWHKQTKVDEIRHEDDPNTPFKVDDARPKDTSGTSSDQDDKGSVGT